MSLRQFQRYEILSELSRGGMGAIYSARDPGSGAELAIKTILGPLTDKARARFEREALVLAQISHPNIIPIHSYGIHENVPYLVMARISGQDWASYIAQARRHNGVPPLDLSLSVHAQIAGALAWLHERGLAHRDVKPANILVEDETNRAILIDFGLVLTESSEDLTRTGELIGSLPYLPPEAFDDKARQSPAAMDVWSLSVSLYQSLSGELPFQAQGAELIAKIINSQPRPLSRSAPRSLAALVARGPR
jgi:serine/threonine protein kinase